MRSMRPAPPPAPNRKPPRVVEGYVLWYDSSLKMLRRGTHPVSLVTEEIGLCEIQPGEMLTLQRVDGRWLQTGEISSL